MLRSMFNIGHARPLDVTRILRPRISRGEDLKRSRDIDRSWPRTRQIREHEQSENRTQSLDLSVSANYPCPRSVRAHMRGHKQSASANTLRSQQSATKHWQRTRTIRRQSAVSNCPRQRTGHGPDLSVNIDWQGIVRAGAFWFPLRRQHVPRSYPHDCILCPHLIQPQSARRSRNLRPAVRRNSRTSFRRRMSSQSCGRNGHLTGPSPNCSRSIACRRAKRPSLCSVTTCLEKSFGHAVDLDESDRQLQSKGMVRTRRLTRPQQAASAHRHNCPQIQR